MTDAAQPRPGFRFRAYGPEGAQIQIEVPDRDEVQEQIDLIRWAVLDPEKASLRARITELESRPPEIREVEKIVERVVEAPVPAVEVAPVELGEPMPDALRDSLARLVEPDANEAAKKAALMQRWITLKAQMEDKKRPERDRTLPSISTAEEAEFEQLEAYMNWFK